MLKFTVSGQHDLRRKLCFGDQSSKTLLRFMKELSKAMKGSLGEIRKSERKYEYELDVFLPSIEDAEEFIRIVQEKLTPSMRISSPDIPESMSTILPQNDGITPYYSGDGVNHSASIYENGLHPQLYVNSKWQITSAD